MAVKGYYASICHGLTMMGALLNIILGIAMIVIGLMTSFNFLTKAFHANILGFVLVGGGVFILLNGIIGVAGGVRESLPGIKANMFFSIGQLLSGLVMLIFAMISMKNEEKLRMNWGSMPEETRSLIETKMSCCGFDDITDGTPECKFKKPCVGFIPLQYKKKIMTAGAISAIGVISGAITLFGSFCLQKKMRKQNVSDKKKQFASLADEARGITRKQRSKNVRDKARGERREKTVDKLENV